MKLQLFIFITIIVVVSTIFLLFNKESNSSCLIGSFISDTPTQSDIASFTQKYGKKPYFIMIFVSWEKFIKDKIIKSVYSCNSVLMVTWEPWYPKNKESIDYKGILKGKYDNYITKFANHIKNIDGEVYLRFAHEPNGNWYPWSGVKIGIERYKKIYRYIRKIFEKEKVDNVKWIFSVNANSVPQENNSFLSYYPGDKYVDYVGIDGYNWGTTKKWSKWRSFRDIFMKIYKTSVKNINKPVIITEFSSTSKGGDKAQWIKKTLLNIKRMKNIKGFVIFNVEKETDWSFPIHEKSGKMLRDMFQNKYFKSHLE